MKGVIHSVTLIPRLHDEAGSTSQFHRLNGVLVKKRNKNIY